MSRIMFTTVPITGHVRPGLGLARELVRRGHEVIWYTGAAFADTITATGATFVPITRGRDYDDSDLGGHFPARPRKPGVTQLRWDVEHVFVRTMEGYLEDLDPLAEQVQPDAVVADSAFSAGLLLARDRGIPSAVFGVTPLMTSSVDTAPFGLGLRPSATAAGRVRNRMLNWAVRHLVFASAQRAAQEVWARRGLPPLAGLLFDQPMHEATVFLHGSVPEFEYPRSDLPGSVRFVGLYGVEGVDVWTPPPWWADLEGTRPVVLVTQGTLAIDPADLLLPAIDGLRDADVLVVATTGGADPEDVLATADRPANLRIDRFIPFAKLLPHVDVMVTNGGFGGVQQALAAGVPLVGAGRTEDKAEVNARIAWSGAGLSLRTDRPSPQAVATAVHRVLADPSFRRRATELRDSYARRGGAAEAADAVESVMAEARPVPSSAAL